MNTPRLLFVPVRSNTVCQTLFTAHRENGTRVGIAFSSQETLATAMGSSQPSVRLSLEALRQLLTPLGIDHIQLDAVLVIPNPSTEPDRRLEHDLFPDLGRFLPEVALNVLPWVRRRRFDGQARSRRNAASAAQRTIALRHEQYSPRSTPRPPAAAKSSNAPSNNGVGWPPPMTSSPSPTAVPGS